VSRLVRLAKWGLLIVGLGWAVYTASSLLALAGMFPPNRHDTTEIIGSIQAYAVVFGPMILAALFLLIRWPEGGNGNSKERDIE